MKSACFVLIALLFVGCSTTQTKVPARQAGALALRAANEKAAELYGAEPFTDATPAYFLNGEWIWQQRRGFGSGDIETTVHLAPNGGARSVDVMLLDNRPTWFF